MLDSINKFIDDIFTFEKQFLVIFITGVIIADAILLVSKNPRPPFLKMILIILRDSFIAFFALKTFVLIIHVVSLGFVYLHKKLDEIFSSLKQS